ncbi:MAG: CHASE2 domain-containing protein [Candidatus Scalindua sp.]|jgi:HD-GYP domain-containing protein (c-di-GMP phosphodiesterase class II)/CHASE2 domain-containing sensor protein|nr:CHASE2 domain-containing protein [Candidatus Scalindua sp.]MBT5304033.1 CHASE2 domain-containing protein [Candidatus Scalindua sp.]MBT6228013.1 CHASE2 domain-containing protein [Candidatus Scalindua sp.]MBT6562955.1 CHASE2 domain-containing protein [Candidatus Scalindua sp.]MBT7211145.1 CHASE2 domain-containing protein [Candidatus Scalindua sp.]
MELLGRWPWPRSRYAELLGYLKEGGASVIAFDMFFDMPDIEGAENDFALSEAADNTGMTIFSVWSPTANLFKTRPLDGIYKGRLSESIDIIAGSAKGVGHLNLFYDSDGVARRVPIQIADTQGKERFMPLSLAAFLEQKGIDQKPELSPGSLLKIGNLHIPLDSKSCIPINYIDFEKQVHIYHRSNVKWLEKIGQEKPITLYSFSDVFPQDENSLPASQFKDNIVFIGLATPGSEQDVHVTPFGRKFGIFIQANLLYNFLADRLISIPGPIYTISILTALSIIFGILIFKIHIRGSTYLLLAGSFLVLFAISAIIAFTGLILFQKLNIMIDMIPFAAMFLMLIGTCLAVNLSTASGESAMRDLQLNLLLEVGEITTSKDESDQYSLKLFKEDIEITSALAVPLKPPIELLEPIKKITHCEATALYVLDDHTGDFAYSDFSGRNEIKEDSLKTSAIVNKWIQSDAKPFWIDNVSKHPDLPHVNINNLHCLLAIPLIVKKQTIGIFYLYNKLASKISPSAEFTSDELRLISSFTHQIAVAIENHRLHVDIHDIFLDYIKSIASALDARDTYTHGHSHRVAEFSVEIGKQLGLSEGELEFLELSATIHDIGKIGISESVLNKPGKLTNEEFLIIKSHPVKGSKILEPMSRLHALMPGVRNHHERYDGKGYPDGLKGEENHLVARIISIADTYDAMTSSRVYRKGLPPEVAYKEIEKGAGTQFDPKLAKLFVDFMRKSQEITSINT